MSEPNAWRVVWWNNTESLHEDADFIHSLRRRMADDEPDLCRIVPLLSGEPVTRELDRLRTLVAAGASRTAILQEINRIKGAIPNE